MSNPYIQRRGTYWVIVQRGSNRVLSRHRSKSSAEASLKATEAGKQKNARQSLFGRKRRFK